MSVMAMPMVAEGRRPYRRADLEHTPDDGRRYELIDGYSYVSAAPGLVHQRPVLAVEVLPPSTRYAHTNISYEEVVLTQPYRVTIVPADLVR